MCDAVYIGNTQHTLKEIMGGRFFDILCLLKSRQKSDSFAANFEQKFNATISCTYLHKYIMFEIVKKLNPIDAMKTFMKPNCSLFMGELLTILKILCDKCVMVMNNNLEMYRACRNKTTFYLFFLSTDDTILKG